MVKIKLVFYFFLAALIFSSCAAKKRAAEFEAQPEWLKQKPNIPGYYVGVGSAKKVGTRNDYIEKAKEDALADMANEISIQISATSVLHTIETQYGLTDYFDQHIIIKSDDYLEGFEPVDFYENDDSYWVYYRISKEAYKRAKEKRKAGAVANAKAKYLSGIQVQEKNNPAEAIGFYLQGLQAIKRYMPEETPVDMGGKTVDLGNELYTALSQVISLMKIMPEKDKVDVKRGESLPEPLIFTVYFNDRPANGIPVKLKYTGGYLKVSQAVSDGMGRVFVYPGIVGSKNQVEEISASIDLKAIGQTATDDLFIRGLLSNWKLPPAITMLYVSMPNLALVVNEDFCEKNDCRSIDHLFEKAAVNAGYTYQQDDSADFIFTMELKYVKTETAGKLTSITLGGSIEIKRTDGQLLKTVEIAPVTGSGYTRKTAGDHAYNELLKVLNLIYFRNAIESVE